MGCNHLDKPYRRLLQELEKERERIKELISERDANKIQSNNWAETATKALEKLQDEKKMNKPNKPITCGLHPGMSCQESHEDDAHHIEEQKATIETLQKANDTQKKRISEGWEREKKYQTSLLTIKMVAESSKEFMMEPQIRVLFEGIGETAKEALKDE